MKRAWTAIVAMVVVAGCGAGLRPFPPREPMWRDPDRRPFAEPPEEYYSPWAWDAADQSIFRPLSRFFAVDPGGEAVNVNAVDEVPDSSWFTNRIGRWGMTPEQVAQGPCTTPPLDTRGPWTVTDAKPNGANPGFIIKDQHDRRYLLKFDGNVQGPRATAADVIVSRMYYAAGFSTPCNRIVFFDRSILDISPKAMSEDERGNEVPMTEADLDKIFDKALQLPDGRYRCSSSLFLEGKPLGPFRYESTRSDDPNDVVNHEDRRELRGTRLLAAWTNHFDSREQNTLTMWMEVPGKGGYVRHNIIDFGDCFGSIWEPPMLGRRIGHSYYLDIPDLFADFLTFGLISRPWDKARFGPSQKVFGYYNVELFEPEDWKPGYPNPAMGRMTERDGAWMARIIAQFTDAHLRAVVRTGQLSPQELEDELVRILIGRRDKILRRYLSRLSPLTWPRIRLDEGQARLCLRDLAVQRGVFAPARRQYTARTWLSTSLYPGRPVRPKLSPPHDVCVTLPPVGSATKDDPGYLIVDVTASAGSQERLPARVHLYHVGARHYLVVGLERLYDDEPPS